MLEHIDVGERSVESYRGIAPDAVLDALISVAGRLRGARVLHVNATPYGGGVSELLRSVVPLLNDLGLKADWKIIQGGEAFFRATKSLHNGLQGGRGAFTREDREVYLGNCRRNAAALEADYDVITVHDPQPAAILPLHGKGSARWVWRCHIDTSAPEPETWSFFKDYLGDYDAAVFTMPEFQPPGLPIARVKFIPPAIDPMSPKNLELSDATARRILDWLGVRLERPLITQVARFDRWKDPCGVIAAYRLAREEFPELQLALAGSMALDDPEGWEIHRQLRAETRRDPLVRLHSNLTGVGNMEINAFQRLSRVVVQKSIREGFGLVISEALWKGTPVVAGRAGGIKLQMADGVGGFLVDGVEDCAAALVRLLKEPEEAKVLAERGRERVRERFLLPRLLLDELTLDAELLGR